MKTILILECMQEISSFNPVISRYDDFAIQRGEEINVQIGLNTAVGGMIEEVGKHSDFHVVPIFSARAGSAGPLGAASWDRLFAEIIKTVKDFESPIDGIYFSMHGAMAAENELDPEGVLLESIRMFVGPKVPIVISLDLHGILTARMLANINAFSAYHTYPHVDFADTGSRAAQLLIDIVNGEITPSMVRVPIPALVRGDELLTATGCYGEMIKELQSYEQSGQALAAALMIGNPFTDVPELCSQVVIVTNEDPQFAQAEACRIAETFWRKRKLMQAALVPLESAIEKAILMTGPVIFTDAADATSSGASGDSAEIIEALMKAKYLGRVLAPIVDKEAAQMAHQLGVGSTITLTLGGSLDPRFQRIELSVRVVALSEGLAKLETSQHELDAGLSAVLSVDNYTILVMSRAVSLFDRAMFFAHGLNPKNFDLIVVKSPYCEYHMFDEWSEANFNIDAQGSTSADIPSLGHQHCTHPMYPTDHNLDFKPKPQIYKNYH